MGKVFNLDNYARGFYGDKDYTIREGITSGKGKLELRNNLETRFKNEYYYVEGWVAMRVNGNQARKLLNNN